MTKKSNAKKIDKQIATVKREQKSERDLVKFVKKLKAKKARR